MLLYFLPVRAQHAITGYITCVKDGGSLPYAYTITLTYYSTPDVDAAPALLVDFGDGSAEYFDFSGDITTSDVRIAEYIGSHHYAAPGTYKISCSDNLMIADIINVSGSVNVPLYTETELEVPELVLAGFNNSPIITNPPLIFAKTGDVVLYNPGAYDVDGDALSYSFYEPDYPGYEFPLFLYPPPAELSIDSMTGIIVWDAITSPGIFLLPLAITEMRDGSFVSTTKVNVMIFSDTEPLNIGQTDNLADAVSVWPVPTENVLHIRFNNTVNKIELCALNGDIVKSNSVISGLMQYDMDMKDLPAGSYMLRCFGNNGSSSQKIIKK